MKKAFVIERPHSRGIVGYQLWTVAVLHSCWYTTVVYGINNTPKLFYYTLLFVIFLLIHLRILSTTNANTPSRIAIRLNAILNYISYDTIKSYLPIRERNQLHHTINWRDNLQRKKEEESKWHNKTIIKRLVLLYTLHKRMTLITHSQNTIILDNSLRTQIIASKYQSRKQHYSTHLVWSLHQEVTPL